MPIDNINIDEYDPFRVFYTAGATPTANVTDINTASDGLVVSSSIPKMLNTTVKMHSTTNTTANGIICNTTTSCLKYYATDPDNGAISDVIKCVDKTAAVEDVNEYGFCYTDTACNRIKNYAPDTRMKCDV